MAAARIRRRDKVFLASAFAAVVFFSSISIAVNALAPDVPTPSNITAPDPRVQDGDYLLRLGSIGLPVATQAEAIALGRSACAALKSGDTGTTVTRVLVAQKLTAGQAAKVIYAAVGAYCPGLRLASQS